MGEEKKLPDKKRLMDSYDIGFKSVPKRPYDGVCCTISVYLSVLLARILRKQPPLSLTIIQLLLQGSIPK